MNDNQIIHVGVAKSGTTFLQRILFELHPNVIRLGQPYEDKALRRLVDSLKRDDDYDFDFAALEAKIEAFQNVAQDGERVFVFSDETLTSPEMKSIVADRLHRLFGPSKILITIRNQISSIQSYYARQGRILKRVPGKWNGRHIEFEEWFDYCVNNPRGTHLDRINYKKIMKIYMERFGEENVHVLLFEDMANSNHVFTESLMDLLGGPTSVIENLLKKGAVNPRSTVRAHVHHKLRSRFLWGGSLLKYLPVSQRGKQAIRSTFQAFLQAGKRDTVDLPDYALEKIREIYKDSNQWVAEETGLDIKRHGYPL